MKRADMIPQEAEKDEEDEDDEADEVNGKEESTFSSITME